MSHSRRNGWEYFPKIALAKTTKEAWNIMNIIFGLTTIVVEKYDICEAHYVKEHEDDKGDDNHNVEVEACIVDEDLIEIVAWQLVKDEEENGEKEERLWRAH